MIKEIADAIKNQRVYITDHADEEAVNDNLNFEEIYFSLQNGALIENYPDDKPYPSCLIAGNNFAGRAIHSVWAYNKNNLQAVLVTVYRPDPARWKNWKTRTKR